MKAYPAYKESNLPWMSSLPSQWILSKLKYSLEEIIGGGTPNTSNPNFWDNENGIPWVAISDISKQSLLKDTAKKISKEGLASKGLQIIPEGTLLISIFASLGKTTLLDIDATVNQAILGLIPSEKLERDFLAYFLSDIERYISFYSSSNTQENLNLTKIRNLNIALPPLPEQKAIAAFLDRKTQQIDTLIEKKQRQIALLEEQRTALINQAVTKGLDPSVAMKDSGIEWLGEIPSHWYIVPTRRIIDVRDGTHDTPEYIEPSENSVPFVTSKDFDGDTINFDDAKYISADDHELFIQRSKVDNGDVLMSMIGGNIGKALIVLGYTDFSIKNVALFKTHGNLALAKFVLYYIRSGLLDTQIELQSRGGAQSFLSLTDIRNLLFFKIPQEEYEAITVFLDKQTETIEKQLQVLKKEIDLIAEYRTALISSAVTGKIDVRENR